MLSLLPVCVCVCVHAHLVYTLLMNLRMCAHELLCYSIEQIQATSA